MSWTIEKSDILGNSYRVCVTCDEYPSDILLQMVLNWVLICPQPTIDGYGPIISEGVYVMWHQLLDLQIQP